MISYNFPLNACKQYRYCAINVFHSIWRLWINQQSNQESTIKIPSSTFDRQLLKFQKNPMKTTQSARPPHECHSKNLMRVKVNRKTTILFNFQNTKHQTARSIRMGEKCRRHWNIEWMLAKNFPNDKMNTIGHDMFCVCVDAIHHPWTLLASELLPNRSVAIHLLAHLPRGIIQSQSQSPSPTQFDRSRQSNG